MPYETISGGKARRGGRMTASDRQGTFTGTKEVAAPLRFDVGAA